MQIHHETQPDPADSTFVLEQLKKFNSTAHPKPFAREQVYLFVRDEEGKIKGGLMGGITMDWLQISILWLDDSLRGEGWGAQLVEQAEAIARKNNAVGAYVETTTFQARPFYERMGYEVFSHLDDMPRGATTWFLKKLLG